MGIRMSNLKPISEIKKDRSINDFFIGRVSKEERLKQNMKDLDGLKKQQSKPSDKSNSSTPKKK